ncbi:hypothetical protein ABZ734_33080 [Streptomyces sp. NPDC006660]|uniref:hypothetical protein n=1 Tax=unclassified Streptomyces TaxID=2593676 RepID=UPI0033E26A7F
MTAAAGIRPGGAIVRAATGQDGSMSLPDAITATLAAREKVDSEQDFARTRQIMTFVHATDDAEAVELGMFEGPLPIPAVGQNVTLWVTGHPLVVQRVETHYGLGGADTHPGREQVASVIVFVAPRTR